MRFLIVDTDNNTHYLTNELTQNNLIESEADFVRIFDIELKLYHVKDNTWQQIIEK